MPLFFFSLKDDVLLSQRACGLSRRPRTPTSYLLFSSEKRNPDGRQRELYVGKCQEVPSPSPIKVSFPPSATGTLPRRDDLLFRGHFFMTADEIFP